MKRFVLSILLALGCYSGILGQELMFSISGTVTDCKNKKPVKDIPVKVVCSDGNVVETKTDEKGNYILLITPAQTPVSCILHCNTETITSCWMSTGEKRKFTLSNSSAVKRTEDFCVVNMGKTEEILFPDIYFDEHSIASQLSEDSKIKGVIAIMQNNPTFVIEISAYSQANETTKDSLRAEHVKNKIIGSGIKPDRLPIRNKPRSNSPKDQKPKVVFSIIRTDYGLEEK